MNETFEYDVVGLIMLNWQLSKHFLLEYVLLYS